jgi:hypothetical protein
MWVDSQIRRESNESIVATRTKQSLSIGTDQKQLQGGNIYWDTRNPE